MMYISLSFLTVYRRGVPLTSASTALTQGWDVEAEDHKRTNPALVNNI